MGGFHRKIIGSLVAVAVAVGIGVGVYVSGGSALTANVWISSNGTSSGANCSWHITPITDPGSGNCDPQTAYVKMPSPGCGGTVGATAGTYATLNIFYTVGKDGIHAPDCTNTQGCRDAQTYRDGSVSVQSYQSCLFYKCATPGACIVSNYDVEVPYVYLYPGWTSPQQTSDGLPPDYNINFGANLGRAGTCADYHTHDSIADGLTTGSFAVHSSDYVFIKNSTFGFEYPIIGNGTSQVSPCKDASANTNVSHFVYNHNLMQEHHPLTAANPGPPKKTQSATGEVSSGTSVVATLVSAPAITDTLVAVVSAQSNPANTLSCSGFTAVPSGTTSVGLGGMAMFYFPYQKNNASTTVTCSTSDPSSTGLRLVVTDYANISIGRPVPYDSSSATNIAGATTIANAAVTPTKLGSGCVRVNGFSVVGVAKDVAGSFNGAWPNTTSRTVTDGVTNGTTTITSQTAAFTTADVGRTITGSADLPANNTIFNITNSTTATLEFPATGSHNLQTFTLGDGFVTSQTSASGYTEMGYKIYNALTSISTSETWTGAANAGVVVGNFACMPSNHTEGIHWNAGDNSVIENSRFINVGVGSIEFENNFNVAPASSISNNLVQNNVMDKACSNSGPLDFCSATNGGQIAFYCHTNPATMGPIDIINNSFDIGAGSSNPFGAIDAPGCNMNNIRYIGNILNGPATSGACTAYGTLNFTFSFNAFNNAVACGSNLVNVTSAAVYTQASNYDYTEASGSPSINLNSGPCAPTDTNGIPRNPVGPCDAGAYQKTAYFSSKGTGGSFATCSPSPCTQGNASTRTINVLDSSGSNAKTVTRTYYVERPNNLTNSPSNLAPLIIHSGCPQATPGGSAPSGCQPAADVTNWQPQSANAGCTAPATGTCGYVMIYFNPIHNCAVSCQFSKPTVETVPGTGDQNCGVSPTTNQCDDIPLILAAVQATITAENIDPNKIFMTGESKGGQLSEDVICDTRMSSIVRAASVVSNSTYPISLDTGGSQSVMWPCPALLGTSRGYGGGAGLNANTDLSVQFVYGDNDAVACGSLPATCLNTGGTRSDGRWAFGDPQVAGDASAPSPSTLAGVTGNIGDRLGCPSSPSSTSSPTVHVFVRTFAGCTVNLRATETVRIAGQGHTACSAPVVDNFDCALSGWNFMKDH